MPGVGSTLPACASAHSQRRVAIPSAPTVLCGGGGWFVGLVCGVCAGWVRGARFGDRVALALVVSSLVGCRVVVGRWGCACALGG